jgi:transposase-like protein
MQGRPKGGKNKYYSKEEKLKYVEQMLNGRSCWEIEREDGISHSITNRWLNKC